MARSSDVTASVSSVGCHFDWVKTTGLLARSSQPLLPKWLAYSYRVGPVCQSSSSWSLAKRGRNSPSFVTVAKMKEYSHCCIVLLLASLASQTLSCGWDFQPGYGIVHGK